MGSKKLFLFSKVHSLTLNQYLPSAEINEVCLRKDFKTLVLKTGQSFMNDKSSKTQRTQAINGRTYKEDTGNGFGKMRIVNPFGFGLPLKCHYFTSCQ